ncbi:hypothetical protein [Aeromonas allosaccharophila]|uniref:hypothetical protein n=2 Tax=Aeromonas TaxID=642 RepID=UPI003432C9CF
MATLHDIEKYIELYSLNIRNQHLPPIIRSNIYSLQGEQYQSTMKATVFWPDTWPHNDKYGVYAIFSDEQVLYIGKASQNYIGYRLTSHFRYSNDKKSGIPKNAAKWSKPPTHIVAWSVPESSFFEASSLEEYLIYALRDDLPDNRIGTY